MMLKQLLTTIREIFEDYSKHILLREELTLIFMSIDLKSSTNYAECMGNRKYSAFLEDYYSVFLSQKKKFDAKLYQIVGDEIVFTWNGKEESNYQKSINFYFSFKEAIQKRESFFLEKYGVKPEFYVGAHAGKIIKAKLGNLFSHQLLFQGDTINTTARIKEKCKEAGSEILISQAIFNNLHTYSFHSRGCFRFRGKCKSLCLYGLQQYNTFQPSGSLAALTPNQAVVQGKLHPVCPI